MGLLNSLDLIVIGTYLMGITIIGMNFYRKSTGMNECWLGGKGMRWFPVALSVLAADTSAITYLGFPAWSFQHDLKYNQMVFPYLIAVPIVIWLFLPSIREETYTLRINTWNNDLICEFGWSQACSSW
jgi:solute:Na+ symporter, SSS family